MAASTSSTMYRTLTRSVRSSVISCPFRARLQVLDDVKQELDARGEFVRRPGEHRVSVVGVRRLGGRVGHAPVRHPCAPREVRADLADTVAQADHMVEGLTGELVEVLGPAVADVDAALPHHA